MKEFKNTEEESVRGIIVIYIDSPLETFMDDNHKYSIKEYRDALYTHIA